MAKRKTKPATIPAIESEVASLRDMVEAIWSTPEVRDALMQEGFSQADIELALDDRGWISLGQTYGNEISAQQRQSLVQKSRLYWLRDPLAHQAVRLWTDYSVGTGITYKAKKPVQKELDRFWKFRKNKKLTVSKGQQRLSKKLLIDGELFVAVFDDDGTKTIRTIDCIQIIDIISDPNDEEQVLCYKRTLTDGKTKATKTLYYRDWAADDDDLEGLKDQSTGKDITVEENVVVYHLTFDDIGKRGNGLLFPAVDWSREHRRFMEARVALTQALSKFAWKLTAKTGQAGLNAIQQRLQSSLSTTGTTGGVEKNPPNALAGTFAQNLGADMTPMPRTTGASEASADSNNLKLMVCAATGIMLHYFGDPSTGNLATATAMELPMLKMFASYQELWKDAWRDIFSIVLEEDPESEPEDISITLPPILDADLQKLAMFVTAISAVYPEIKIPEILQPLLNASGLVDNVEDVMKLIADKRTEIDADQAAIAAAAAATAKTNPTGPPNPNDPTVPAQSQEVAALNRLSTVMEEVFGKRAA